MRIKTPGAVVRASSPSAENIGYRKSRQFRESRIWPFQMGTIMPSMWLSLTVGQAAQRLLGSAPARSTMVRHSFLRVKLFGKMLQDLRRKISVTCTHR